MAEKVFISFHMDDRHAKELLVAQAKSDKFDLEFINYAVNEPFDNRWKTQCRERINQCSVVICLIGEKTYQREAVLWELNTAYDLGKKVFGIRIYRDKNHIVPLPLKQHNAKIILWNIPDIVKELEEV
ncbi:MAG: TIR domain-containing protein [Candidatus Aenigmarchaeota archaeon]|nr:TIR domain-containing protein [Candidatus Aenigmarchaeota archaeon]